jgi:hypothetical protein
VRPSIAIVVVFFGRVPQWAPAFFVTCRKNPDIQFLLYTDLDMPGAASANLTLRHMTIADFETRATEALGTPIVVHHHLAKMSDLKPAYGIVFAEDLAGFDYWAYSDFDVAWGDIRSFVTDQLLHDYDVVSARRDRLCGHFTLFRNTPEFNRMFEIIPDVLTVLSSRTHWHMDETVLTKAIWAKFGRRPDHVYWASDWIIDAKYQREMGDGPADCLWWRDGKTYNVEGKELMYLHFHKLKQHMQTVEFSMADAPPAFSISRKGLLAGPVV